MKYTIIVAAFLLSAGSSHAITVVVPHVSVPHVSVAPRVTVAPRASVASHPSTYSVPKAAVTSHPESHPTSISPASKSEMQASTRPFIWPSFHFPFFGASSSTNTECDKSSNKECRK